MSVSRVQGSEFEASVSSAIPRLRLCVGQDATSQLRSQSKGLTPARARSRRSVAALVVVKSKSNGNSNHNNSKSKSNSSSNSRSNSSGT